MSLEQRLLVGVVVGLLACRAPQDGGSRPPLPQGLGGQCGPAPGCGNGVVESGETCDDGDHEAGDGCGANCLVERSNPPPSDRVQLLHRSFTPAEAVAQSVVDAVRGGIAGGLERHHLMAIFARPPGDGARAQWAGKGIEVDDFIHAGAWIVSLPVGLKDDVAAVLEAHRKTMDAESLAAFEPGDKMSTELFNNDPPAWAVDGNLIRVMVRFYRTADSHAIDALALALHASGDEILAPDPRVRGIQLESALLSSLYDSPLVEFVEPGPAPAEPLMDEVRAAMSVSNVERPDVCLTGRGVRMSTRQEFPGSIEDDYQRYNAAGVPLGTRILDGAAGGAPNSHASHVVGIMLGNGWTSALHGGAPFQWRGVAPEAEYVHLKWYDNHPVNLRPQVGSSSVVLNDFSGLVNPMWDERIRGNLDPGHFFTQFQAAGNNGLGFAGTQGVTHGTRGNYAVADGTKNLITVGNVFAEDLRWAANAMGPTFDGRIKPDLTAPGCRIREPYHYPHVEVDEFRIVRNVNYHSLSWHFDDLGDLQGWQPGVAWINDIAPPITQPASPGGLAARITLKPGRPHVEFTQFAPMPFALQPILDEFTNGGIMTKVGQWDDKIEITYRYEGAPMWSGGKILVFWQTFAGSYFLMPAPIVSDGAWHTVAIKVGSDPNWQGQRIVALRYAPYAWNPGAVVATAPGSGYRGSCGTSMAAPAATGVAALMMEQLAASHGVDLDDNVSHSPFDWNGAGPGRPRPSTIKALLVHSARDLARIAREVDFETPDTHDPTEYHKGPDYTTGHGLVDAQEASRLLAANAGGGLPIIERDAAYVVHVYPVTVPANDTTPLKVTLAWDDDTGSPVSSPHARQLVNDLDLALVSPSGVVHHPWTIDLPYDPDSCGGCDPPEAVPDEVITSADLHPARRDLPNDRDNLEVAYVEVPQPGVWTVRVGPTTPLYSGVQKYSLIIGTPPKPADRLTGGKVVFVSDRASPPQLFVVQNNGMGGPPVQLGLYPASPRDPEWSPDGRYVASVVYDGLGGGDALAINDTVGGANQYITALMPFWPSLSQPSWSRDGSEIYLSYGTSPTHRGIGAVNVNTHALRVLIAPGAGPWVPDAPVWAGADPTGVPYVFVHATNNCVETALFRLPDQGGELERLWADGFPTTRALFPSVSRDGKGLLFASDDHLVGAPGFLHREMVEMGNREGVTTHWTGAPGDQVGSYAIGGRGEWVAETNTSPGARRQIEVRQHGRHAALDIGDPGNAWDDRHPSWWVANPSSPIADPDNPVMSCPPALAYPPEPAMPCEHVPPVVTATGSCGPNVTVTTSPALLTGNGPHIVTYTATDWLGHVTQCQTVLHYACGGGGGGGPM